MAWVTSFLDGFDHYVAADVSAKWDSMNFSPSPAIDASVFRNSGQALRPTGGATGSVSKRMNIAAQNIVFGFGWRTGALVNSLVTQVGSSLVTIGNDVLDGSNCQFGLCALNDGKFHVGRFPSTNGSSAVDLGNASTFSINTNTWYYVECRLYIHDTLGAIELRVDGVVHLHLTGIDTRANASLATAQYFQLRSLGNTTWVDDFYLRTEASSSEVTGGFLGDIKVKPYYPNADGTYTAMTCSTGSSHYVLVDETAPNTTDYVSSSTALTKDSFAFQDASETGSIKAVQVSAYCYKMDAGFRGVDVFVKSGATEDFATSVPLSTTQKYATKAWDQDPNTTADWSQANLNAAEFGVRISADI